jgi:hypothetical protein
MPCIMPHNWIKSSLDDKFNGFQLASSLIRSAHSLERLCCVTANLVAQARELVTQGKRRWVDAH